MPRSIKPMLPLLVSGPTVVLLDISLLILVAGHFGALLGFAYLAVALMTGFLFWANIVRAMHRFVSQFPAPLSDEVGSEMMVYMLAQYLCVVPGAVSRLLAPLLLLPPIRRVVGRHIYDVWTPKGEPAPLSDECEIPNTDDAGNGEPSQYIH
jgi:UPF0716 family protein affecting phage T7 exclusion